MEDKTNVLIEKLNLSICDLIIQKAEMRKIHDKDYMEAANIIGKTRNYIFFENQPKIVIIKIFHILDTENDDNISFKNLIKKHPNLIDEFNRIFCSEKKESNYRKNDAIFKYNYDESIEKIKRYRNKQGGHNSFNYSVALNENTFVYTQIYDLINKIESFFKYAYLILTDNEITFDVLKQDFKRKIKEEMKNEIIASKLLAEHKEQEIIKFKRIILNK